MMSIFKAFHSISIKPLAGWLILITMISATIPAFKEHIYIPWIIATVLYAILFVFHSPHPVAFALILIGIPILMFVFPPPLPLSKSLFQFAVITLLWALATIIFSIAISILSNHGTNQNQPPPTPDEASRQHRE